ncbi:MAG: ABC transporter ATP-binding protein [Candidatus Puniceispirillales bacterium]
MTPTTKDAPILRVERLQKVFNPHSPEPVEAVKDVSFQVRPNELTVLLGPSGCGKSTVLRMIAGLELPSSGKIIHSDQIVDGPARTRGMVFQSYTSFEWLTVAKNIEYGMKLNAVEPTIRKERVEHYLELVGLADFRNAYPKQLSGGMKQRVAIARTLANEPELLLMDEPFGALDAETRWNMQELLISLAESTQTTIILVTHDLGEALFLGDRIIFFSNRPATIISDMPVAFKKTKRFARKEDLLTEADYKAAEQELMRLMRSQSNLSSVQDDRGGR